MVAVVELPGHLVEDMITYTRGFALQVRLEERVIEEGFYFSIVVLSYFMRSGALDSSVVLQSYPIRSLASPITILLITSLKHTYLSTCRNHQWQRVAISKRMLGWSGAAGATK